MDISITIESKIKAKNQCYKKIKIYVSLKNLIIANWYMKYRETIVFIDNSSLDFRQTLKQMYVAMATWYYQSNFRR